MEHLVSQQLPQKLYKFTSLEGAKAILKNQNIRFSSPTLFNDPFDCQLKIKPEFNHGDIYRHMGERVYDYVRQRIPVPPTASNYFKSLHQAFEELFEKSSDPDIDEALARALHPRRPSPDEEYWEDPLFWGVRAGRMRIAAFSTTKDPIIMWSHYADHHRGVCLEFETSRPESFFNRAEEVIYSNDLPKFADASQYGEYMLGLLNEDILDFIFRKYLLRKSPEWNYEHEWRCLIDQPKADELYTDQSFHAEDLTSIYLGVRATDRDHHIIRSLCYKKYETLIYAAKRSSNSFTLEFDLAPPF